MVIGRSNLTKSFNNALCKVFSKNIPTRSFSITGYFYKPYQIYSIEIIRFMKIFSYIDIMVDKLKLTLTIKKLKLLCLASHIFCYQIITILNRPIALKTKIRTYFYKIIIATFIWS